jgi:hypothetical protein
VADFEVEMTSEQTLCSTWNSTLAVDGPRRLPKTKAAVPTISKINASSRRYRAPTCSYILIRLVGRGPVSDYQTSSCTSPFVLSFSTGGYHKNLFGEGGLHGSLLSPQSPSKRLAPHALNGSPYTGQRLQVGIDLFAIV